MKWEIELSRLHRILRKEGREDRKEKKEGINEKYEREESG